MPAKGKRVAVRQAQLNRRRRRQGRPASEGGLATVAEADGSVTTIAPAVGAATATTVNGADTEQRQPQPAPTPTRPVAASSPQGRNAQPMAYTHLAGELRRILILAGIVTAVLLGVSFVV
jgi:hypothetical protein